MLVFRECISNHQLESNVVRIIFLENAHTHTHPPKSTQIAPDSSARNVWGRSFLDPQKKTWLSDCQIIHFPNVHMNEVVTWKWRLNIWVLSEIVVPQPSIGCSHPSCVQPSII